MTQQILKFHLTIVEVEYLLNVLNKTQTVGINGSKDLLHMVTMLKSPVNAGEMEKEAYDALRAKFAPAEAKEADKPKEEPAKEVKK